MFKTDRQTDSRAVGDGEHSQALIPSPEIEWPVLNRGVNYEPPEQVTSAILLSSKYN